MEKVSHVFEDKRHNTIPGSFAVGWGEEMKLCKVHLEDVTEQEKELLNSFFFHPYDKLEEYDGRFIMNYGSGEVCPGTNDFGEDCKHCRYVPFFVRRILRRQENFVFGAKSE